MLDGERPLYDPNVERQTLGQLMVLSETHDQDEIKRALGIVRARDFFRVEHKLVFSAILTLHKSGNHFGVEAVFALLERKKKLSEALTHFDLEQMASEGAKVMPLVPSEQAMVLRQLGEYREAVQAVLDLRRFIELNDDPTRIRARIKETSASLERAAFTTNVPTQTFRALLETEYPPSVPVVHPILYAGDCMLVVGHSKIGKSVFALQLAMAVAAGTPVFDAPKMEGGTRGDTPGLPVHQPRDVLYLNLDDKASRIQVRARRMLTAYPDGAYPERLEFAHRWPPLDQGGEGMLHTWAERHPEGVVVVDLLEKIRPARGGNIYQADYAAVGA